MEDKEYILDQDILSNLVALAECEIQNLGMISHYLILKMFELGGGFIFKGAFSEVHPSDIEGAIAFLESENIGLLKSSGEQISLTNKGNTYARKLSEAIRDNERECRIWFKDKTNIPSEQFEDGYSYFRAKSFEWKKDEALRFIKAIRQLIREEGDLELPPVQKMSFGGSWRPAVDKLLQDIKSGELNEEIPLRLALRSLVTWLLISFYEAGLKVKEGVEKLYKISHKIFLDTNVLIAATIEPDDWHQITHHVLNKLKKAQLEKGPKKLQLVTSRITEEEFFHYLDGLATILADTRHKLKTSRSVETVRQAVRRASHYDIVLKCLAVDTRSYRDIRNEIVEKYQDLLRKYDIKVLSDNIYDEYSIDMQGQFNLLERLEIKLRGNFIRDRAEQKMYLINYCDRKSDKESAYWIWTYHRRLTEYEKALLNTERFAINHIMLETILDPVRFAEAANIKELVKSNIDAYNVHQSNTRKWIEFALKMHKELGNVQKRTVLKRSTWESIAQLRKLLELSQVELPIPDAIDKDLDLIEENGW